MVLLGNAGYRPNISGVEFHIGNNVTEQVHNRSHFGNFISELSNDESYLTFRKNLFILLATIYARNTITFTQLI